MSAARVSALLDRFRAGRRAFEQRLDLVPSDSRSVPSRPGDRSARELVIHVAAWLDEANDRIPRLMAGAADISYDTDAFNAEAVERARGWSYDRAFGAFRRAADRFDTMIGESDPDELAEEPDVMRWIECVAGELMDEHLIDLDRLVVAPADEGSEP